MNARAAIAIFCIGCFLYALPTGASNPAVGQILPRGGQRGTEVPIVITGNLLKDAESLLFDRGGIEVIEFSAESETRITAKLRITSDCMLGAHGIRVVTRTGLSNLRTFSVGALPETKEAEPNNVTVQANSIELNTTVNGVAQNEDLDVFRFAATAGQRITAEIEGIRLGNVLFDPYLAIVDSAGFELATCDDLALLRQDACVSLIIPENGDYFVRVRESSYAGNGSFHYRLHLGTFPRPTATLPLGGKPGEVLNFTLLGGETNGETASLTLPTEVRAADHPGGWTRPGIVGINLADEAGVTPSANFFRVNELNNTIETEPNNNHAKANAFEAPGALNGVLSEDRDQDCYKFTAKKDERFLIVVFARQLRTAVDSVLRIHLAGARQIAANDDQVGTDSFLDFTAPEDGEYVITIHDHLRRGGEDFAYRIEVWRPVSSVTAQLPRNREFITVPQGNRMATIVSGIRFNFGGDLSLGLPDLADGLSGTTPNMPANVSRIPMVIEAAVDAPLGASTVDLNIAHIDPGLGISGHYQQDIELALGRNNTVYMAQSADRIPIATTEPIPFSIEVVEPGAPLVQNGSMRLLVKAERAEGFDGPIRLRVPFVPPGVGAGQSITIAQGQTEARIPINANGNAAVRNWPMVVTATAGTGRGPVHCSSQLFTLNVSAPYLSISAQATSAEQGQATDMGITLNRLHDFQGDVTLRMAGLPNKVTAPQIVMTTEQTDTVFEFQIDPASPPGRYKNITCIATIIVDGEPVVHRLSTAELRIDKPLPKPTETAAPTPPPALEPKPSQPTAKPLTRLEKLRKQHQEYRRQQQGGAEADESEGGDE